MVFWVGLETHDLEFFANLDDAALDTTGHHSATTRDGEHVFNRHQERAVQRTLGLGDVAVQGIGQLHDGAFTQVTLVAFHGLEGGSLDDWDVVTGEFVLGQQFTNFHFDEFEQLGVVNHVALVHEHDDVRHTHLTGKQDVLAGLGHRAVSGRHNQDGAVHLGGTSDHVLHVVGVARAVNVGIVAVGRLVLNVGSVDGDAASLLFRRRVNLVVGLRLATKLLRQHRRDRRRQRRLAMINVPNRPHVHVRLGPLKFTFCHYRSSSNT